MRDSFARLPSRLDALRGGRMPVDPSRIVLSVSPPIWAAWKAWERTNWSVSMLTNMPRSIQLECARLRARVLATGTVVDHGGRKQTLRPVKITPMTPPKTTGKRGVTTSARFGTLGPASAVRKMYCSLDERPAHLPPIPAAAVIIGGSHDD